MQVFEVCPAFESGRGRNTQPGTAWGHLFSSGTPVPRQLHPPGTATFAG
jgi:hypothetical protein